ncbi:BnaC07g06780D [Brassica napus]|uniref:BnaC07g06780D protein n=1 Tax=Brassica napus TaxID=3708 RepID=A0A078G5Z4_BRANA|nr:BnaC07g06780D [Brassica napus]
MVSQSNAAGSSGRRRRQNTPKAKLVSRSKKTKRYPVSDSDDDTTPSSMDSTAPTSPPVDVVDVGSSTKFPRRLFAPGFFPTQLRLNIYSKANVIASVASALKGSSTVDRLLCSQFSKLFRLPVARCPNSTKLIGSLLCRQLITIRKYELWFTFDSETEVNEPGSMWKQLFDTTRWWTGFCVSFMNYPWGRTSFLHTISRFLPPPVSFEKTLCDHFGVLLPNIHNKGKRKMIMRPNRKSRKINSTVPKPGQEMHSYPLRSADGLEGTIGNTQPGFSRETRENNENSTLLTPQFDQNATDQRQFDQNATYQEPRTPNAVPDESQTPNPLTTLTIYRFFFFAWPQSYVSPAKKDDTYIGEKAVDVKWDEANPHAYSSVKETNRAIFKKFSDILSENIDQQFAIKTNHIVTNSFFLDIATPGICLSDEHMHVIMQMLWRRRGSVLQKDRRLHFDWGTNIASYVTGMCRGKKLKLQLGRDIDMTSNVIIFDSFITANPTETHVDAHMTPILKSLPHILEQYVGFTDYLIKEGERTYAWNRFQGIYHNNRGGDCGPCAAKFMKMQSNGDGKEEMSRITDKVVDKFREQYAMDCYEEFVGDFQVANEAGMK